MAVGWGWGGGWSELLGPTHEGKAMDATWRNKTTRCLSVPHSMAERMTLSHAWYEVIPLSPPAAVRILDVEASPVLPVSAARSL